MTVNRMLASMSASEFTEWHEYYKLDPWGEERSDWRSGNVCATLVNVNRGKKGRQYKAEDFMPKFKQAGEPEGVRLSPEASVKYAKHMSALIRLQQRKRDGR